MNQTPPSPEMYLFAWQRWVQEFLAYGYSEEEGRRRYACWLAEQVRAGHAEHLPALKDVADEIAWWYHRRHALFHSSYGTIAWGRGGQEVEDWHKYSKAYHKTHGPARWKNAGVRLDSETQPTSIILENYRGKQVAYVSLVE